MSKNTFFLVFVSFIVSPLFSAPIDYTGGTETLNNKNEWSARYAVGKSCDGDGYIELSIDIQKVSSEAEIVLGFGTEESYFAIINSYDGGMCVPCTGNTQSGTLFVTPPRGQSLRTPKTTTTAQYGDTTDPLGARVSLVNGQDQTAQWDKIVGTGSNIGNNGTPMKLTIVTDKADGTTTLTITKSGVTTTAVKFTSTFQKDKDLFLFLGIDNANDETFTLKGITKQTQCYPSGPIAYNGEDDVIMYKNDEWSVKYPVGDACNGDATYQLTIDVLATSAEAELVLGFGTEKNYFAVYNSYDGGMCIPCTGNTQSGTLFVTPPRGQALRTAVTTTTAQYGATTDPLGARVALVNGEDQTANYDKIVGTGSNIGKNVSPLTLKVITDSVAELTTVEITKNGVTTTTMTFTSTFAAGEDLFLFLGIDNANVESFQLNQIQAVTPQCIPTPMCCANSGGQPNARKQARIDKKCARKSKSKEKCEKPPRKTGESPCEWIACTSVVADTIDGDFYIIDNIDNDESFLMGPNAWNGIYQFENNDVWMYGLGVIVLIFVIFAILFKNNRSEYKNVDGVESITPLLANNRV